MVALKLRIVSLAPAFGLVLALASCSNPQPSGPVTQLDRELDRELAAVVQDRVLGMASLSVLSIKGGEVAYERQFGMRSMAEQLPATSDTMYRIASISKLVTTLGVMRLVEQGKLDLDADVSTYLGFKLRNPAFPEQAISLRMLLSHTSSLRDNGGYSWGATTSMRDAMRESAGKWEASHAPGTYFAYSNLNFGIVGTIMEAAGGERFDRLMQRLVLDPLQLRGGYNPSAMPREQWRTIAALYRKRASESAEWNPSFAWRAQVDDYAATAPSAPPGIDSYLPGTNGTIFSPTGGLRISAADLGKIMLMMIDHGQFHGQPFLKAATVTEMTARQWRYEPGRPNGDTYHGLFTQWGLGVQQFESTAGSGSSLVEGGGFQAVGHLGEAYGLLSVFAFDAARRNGVIVLIGGTASDPATTPGKYSAFTRQEESVLTALYRSVVP